MEKVKKVQIPFVLDETTLDEINTFLVEYPHTYSSRSHFIRCACIYLMKKKREGVL